MALRVSRDELLAFGPCDPDRRVALFGRRKYLTASQALDAGATIEDVLWVAGRLGRKDLCVRFALLCAQKTAHLNDDPRVRAALDAAQAWIDNPTEENRLAAREAVGAARAAAAWEGAAAATALAAADAAADAAAAWAATAAAWAAWEAAADAREAMRKEQIAIAKEVFA